MRCLECKRTGFTDDELDEHAAAFGHVRPDPNKSSNRDLVISEQSSDEFEHAPTPSLTKGELLEAFGKMLGADDLKAWARKLIADDAAKKPAAGAGAAGSTSHE